MPEIETWLPVVGHEGFYEVSDLGRVRRVARQITNACCTFTAPCRILPTYKGGRANNYWRVMLNLPHQRFAYVHHLVLAAFIGPRPLDHVICHRNDDGHDNRLVNLYYGTTEDNQRDAEANRSQPAEAGAPF
jgi:hypothetical protein